MTTPSEKPNELRSELNTILDTFEKSLLSLAPLSTPERARLAARVLNLLKKVDKDGTRGKGNR